MMHRYLLTVLLLLAGAGTWAQESAPADDTGRPGDPFPDRHLSPTHFQS
jgi:hypothetical protein